MKRLFGIVIILLLAMFYSLAGVAQAQMVWKTANQVTVAWDAVTTLNDGAPLPAGDSIQYQLYIRTDPSGTPVAGGQPITSATQVTVTFMAEGAYDIGVKAQRMVAGAVVQEIEIAWSNDPAVVAGGQTFGGIYYKAPAGVRNLRAP